MCNAVLETTAVAVQEYVDFLRFDRAAGVLGNEYAVAVDINAAAKRDDLRVNGNRAPLLGNRAGTGQPIGTPVASHAGAVKCQLKVAQPSPRRTDNVICRKVAAKRDGSLRKRRVQQAVHLLAERECACLLLLHLCKVLLCRKYGGGTGDRPGSRCSRNRQQCRRLVFGGIKCQSGHGQAQAGSHRQEYPPAVLFDDLMHGSLLILAQPQGFCSRMPRAAWFCCRGARFPSAHLPGRDGKNCNRPDIIVTNL